MGEKYAEGVILDLEKTWEESDPRTPLICFLSMGSDPTDSIIALGKRLKTETRYVSMGQGQEIHARKLLQQTMAHVRDKNLNAFCICVKHLEMKSCYEIKVVWWVFNADVKNYIYLYK